MKFLFLTLLPLTVTAFAPAPTFGVVRTALNAEARPDTSEMIASAMAASKEFGATSKEARLAWEEVEEMDSSTNQSDAMAMGADLEDCGVDEEASAACIDYGAKLDSLAELLSETIPVTTQIRDIALQIKAIKLSEVAMPAGANNPMVGNALEAAKKASEEFGADSTEAKLAWETLEEISSAGEKSGALGGMLDEECLTEMIEACEAIDEVKRGLDVAKSGGLLVGVDSVQ
eukprot:CAMPEP_0119011574 /NCGR_PEP_ID=MMETSP1176-20130426/5758_1 /TAXON_ID=265551 /ORGANISM="Synedropsis recta cf, Strain CCMP1620" /LENGTH=230 /DNA_ID=CAMNT_0006964423 /DNA_START=29 /DNA_END=721 /DNA_ORIENTATION=+